jgi:threonine synthase
MKYYSTNDKKHQVDLKEAVFKGLALDKGLYMPQYIPVLLPEFLIKLKSLSFKELSLEIAMAFFGDDIPRNELKKINDNALDFETPLEKIDDDLYCLELFHGPTMAFKDVGARYMARMLAYFTRGYNREINVLVATSGDTGSAVGNGFLGVPGIRVHILYPKGLVSNIQEKQFTTLGENITAVEVAGSFDDCQRLVKEAFVDKEINAKLTLTSANSINLARLLPQSFYYFNAFRQLPVDSKKLVFSVPSGNFGNLTAGLIAKKMGLPVDLFLAATNINDVVPEYLKTGIYRARPSVATVANAMDVGDPSNFARILDLYSQNQKSIASEIKGYSYSDRDIKNCILQVNRKYGYIPDPHGATAFMALSDFRRENPGYTGIFLETAHPAKFSETVEEAIGEPLSIPRNLAEFSMRTKVSVNMGSKYVDFKGYLMGL